MSLCHELQHLLGLRSWIRSPIRNSARTLKFAFRLPASVGAQAGHSTKFTAALAVELLGTICEIRKSKVDRHVLASLPRELCTLILERVVFDQGNCFICSSQDIQLISKDLEAIEEQLSLHVHCQAICHAEDAACRQAAATLVHSVFDKVVRRLAAEEAQAMRDAEDAACQTAAAELVQAVFDRVVSKIDASQAQEAFNARDASQADNLRLTTHLKQGTQELAIVRRQASAQAEAIVSAQQQIACLKCRLYRTSHNNVSLHAKLRRRSQHLKTLHIQLETQSQQITHVNADLNRRAQQDLAETRTQLDVAQALAAKLDKQLQSRNASLEDMRAWLQASQQEQQHLSSDNDSLVARNKDLANDVCRASKMQAVQMPELTIRVVLQSAVVEGLKQQREEAEQQARLQTKALEDAHKLEVSTYQALLSDQAARNAELKLAVHRQRCLVVDADHVATHSGHKPQASVLAGPSQAEKGSQASLADSSCDYLHNYPRAYLDPKLPLFPQDCKPGEISVQQLTSVFWQLRCQAVLEKHDLPSRRPWDLHPAPLQSDLPHTKYFNLKLQSMALIGKGGFGGVFYQQRWVGSPGSGQDGCFEAVAAKYILETAAADQEVLALTRVRKALQAQPGPHHIIHLVETMRALEPQGIFANIVCKFVEGHHATHAFKALRERSKQGTLLQRQQAQELLLDAVAHFGQQMLKGLGVLHKLGLVHADVKSSNTKVTMQPDGSGLHSTLVDLGSCRATGTSCGQMAITPLYAAPEVLATFTRMANFSLSTAADIWSLACLMYEVLTGCSLFDSHDSSDDHSSDSDPTHDSSNSADSASAASETGSAQPPSATAAGVSSSGQRDAACRGPATAFFEWGSATSCSSNLDSTAKPARQAPKSQQHMVEQHQEWEESYRHRQLPEAMARMRHELRDSKRGTHLVHLLMHMLHPQSHARWQAEQVLAHPFFLP